MSGEIGSGNAMVVLLSNISSISIDEDLFENFSIFSNSSKIV